MIKNIKKIFTIPRFKILVVKPDTQQQSNHICKFLISINNFGKGKKKFLGRSVHRLDKGNIH